MNKISSQEMYLLALARSYRILGMQPPKKANKSGKKSPHARYGMGLHLGVSYERGGILQPETGLPEDPLVRKGIEDGRRWYREQLESLCAKEDI